SLQDAAQQPLQGVGITLHDGGSRIARAQQAAEGRIELNQHKARRIDPLCEQRLRYRPRAGAKLDDGTRPVGIDIGRHGTSKHPAGWRHSAGGQRLPDPGANEAHLVVETNAVLLLEVTNARFDLLFLCVELLLEFPFVILELLLDLSFELALPLLE